MRWRCRAEDTVRVPPAPLALQCAIHWSMSSVSAIAGDHKSPPPGTGPVGPRQAFWEKSGGMPCVTFSLVPSLDLAGLGP